MTKLGGLRVLVVEDEATVAMLVEDMLEDLGCQVVASLASVGAACDAVARTEMDLAVLDVNVAGELVFPVAEALRDRQIPFLFSTGYGTTGLPSGFSACAVVTKPFSQADLREKLLLTLRS